MHPLEAPPDLWLLAAIVRQILSIVANVKLHFFKYIDLSSITVKISLSLPEAL